MNIISCNKCGVVLDSTKLDFPFEIYDEDGAVINENAEWSGSDFVPKVACPVCGNPVLKST